MTAYAMLWPADDVYHLGVVPMRVRSLVLGLSVLNLGLGWLGTAPDESTNVAYLAHVGGSAAAYVYVRRLTRTGMDQVRQRVANLPAADEPPRAIPRSMPRSRLASLRRPSRSDGPRS